MLKTSLRLAWRGLNHLTRIALVGAVLLALAGGALVLGLRYWILPDIEHYHGLITGSVSQAIGQPVSIGKIEADWRGMRPHLLLTDVRILDKNKPDMTALALQHVDGVVSWKTLLRGEVRLYRLELDQPDLLVRRDAQGLLHIAGVALTDQSSGQNGLADWLLHQTYLVVRDARITWLDEQRATPPLVFNQLNLLIHNSWRHHRFALRALPPTELSAQLDVRGDFSGRSFNDLNAWRGQLYTQLDYADVAAWRTWLPLPAGFKRGRGALRGWLDVADGKVSQVTADLALADVQAQLGEGLTPLDLHTLRGRIGWMDSGQGVEVSTHQLSLQTDSVEVKPTDFYLRLAYVSDKQPASGEVRANTLELANLVSLTDSLPLSHGLKKKLAEFAPQGTVSGLQAKWQADVDKPVHYEVKAQFDQLSMKRVGKLPGFSGLSGELEGSETTGILSLNAHKLTVDAPQIMPEPLAFDTLTAQGSWQTKPQGMEVKFSNVSVANADLAGTVYGSFQSLPDSPGLIDLNISLPHAAIHHADRYIPLDALGEETHAWLRSALLDGQADDFHLRLHGDLNDFPFPENKKGIFQIQSRIRGGALEYAKDWPHIDNITGELLIQGKRLQVNAPSGMTVGAHLQKVSVTMPDMASPDMMLQVRGEVAGETARSLDFIQKSPVHGYIDGFTDGMKARGNGNLQLSVDVPLRGSKPVTLSGDYHFADNEVDMGDGVPVLYSANGDLQFTESTMRTKNFNAQILGGPATLVMQSGADGTVQAKVHGKADMDSLRNKVSYPLLSRLHGGSDWDAEITVQKKLVDVLVTSNLSGLVSDLPAPLAKRGGEVVPLRFERKSVVTKQDVISLQYGRLLNARLLRREEGGDMVIKRGTVNFGGASKWLNRDGVWIAGTVPHLSLVGWGGLFSSAEGGTSGESSPFSIAGADLTIQRLDAYGLSMNGLHVNARNQDGVFTAKLAAKEINGEVSWQSEDKGKLVARLRNLTLGGGSSGTPSEADSGHLRGEKNEVLAWEPAASEDFTSTELPALDLTVDELTWKDKQLGKMELLARQHGSDWHLEHMRITNPDGVLTADGKYHMAEGKKQTQLNLKLEISNAGHILARSGYPDSVKNGSGKLEGEFTWRGAPDDFSYAALDGKLKLDTGNGQFLKVDPGAGKLLSILSLQALPTHITLGFTDVFSQGFAFDSITGTAQIKQGVFETNDFRIDGLSAKVTMQGQVDLNRETQNLRVRILPTVGNSVSLLGFAGGPLVGIGTFIANKILREPLDKLASFEYNVTGTWVNPSVTKIGQPAAGSAGKENNP
jgi:uncharacterized protein (TIGR02099 family)